MKVTNQKDFLTLLKGATFLASGGGGPFFLAKEIVQTYFKGVENFEINIVAPDSLTEKEWVVMAAGMAQPSAGSALTPQAIIEPTVNAVKAIEKLLIEDDNFSSFKKFDALYLGEIGAMNVTIPLISAYLLQNNLSIVDGDSAGRSAPTINLTTFGASQPVMPNMATSAGEKYEFVTMSLKNYKDLGTAYSRLIQAGLIGIDTGLCLAPMTGKTLNDDNIVKGSLNDAFNIGKIFEEDISSNDKITKIQKYLFSDAQISRKMKHICTGRVTSYYTESINDTDLGYLTLQTDGNRVYTILIQNENMIGQFSDEISVNVTGPDSICYIANEKCSFGENEVYENVLISQKLEKGEDVNIHIVAIEAADVVKRNEKLMSFWNEAYKTSRYYGSYNSKLWS